MSFMSSVGGRGKRAAVTIAWPKGPVVVDGSACERGGTMALGLHADARVLSARGLVPADALVPGDMLADGRGGWTRLAAVIRAKTDLGAERVRIRAGALGGGRPSADLVVGRETRLRLRSDLARRLFGHEAVLVAAEHLLRLDGVTRQPEPMHTAVHLVFEEHAVFVAEDVVVEAFVPTPLLMESIPPGEAERVRAALPKLRFLGAMASYAAGIPETDARETRRLLSGPTCFGADPDTVAPCRTAARAPRSSSATEPSLVAMCELERSGGKSVPGAARSLSA